MLKYYEIKILKGSLEYMKRNLMQSKGKKIYQDFSSLTRYKFKDWEMYKANLGKDFQYIDAIVTKIPFINYVMSANCKNSLGIMPLVFQYEYYDELKGKKCTEFANFTKDCGTRFFKSYFAFLDGGFIENFNPNLINTYIKNELEKNRVEQVIKHEFIVNTQNGYKTMIDDKTRELNFFNEAIEDALLRAPCANITSILEEMNIDINFQESGDALLERNICKK